MDTPVIALHTVTKNYHKQCVVDKVDMCINKGEIYGLVGKNGAGKTTIMRLIAGLTVENEGDIELFGKSSKKEVSEMRRRLGGVIESPAFYPYMSAKKNLEYYRIQRGIPDKACVERALEDVGLLEVKNKKFKQFSLGMKQRLGLALAIMGDPDVLLLDEPINGLDPTGIVEIREVLRRLNEERHITIIISSHILSELGQLATRYGFINEGRLVEEISAKQLEDKCKHYLSIKVDDVGKATAIIEKYLECNKYEVVGNEEIHLFEYVDTPERVTKVLVENGLMVYTINQVSSSLEEYFVELVGGKVHA